MAPPVKRDHDEANPPSLTYPPAGSVRGGSPLQPGAPFRKMHKTRDAVRKAVDEVKKAETALEAALSLPESLRNNIEQLKLDVRLKSAELVSLQNKLNRLEANFRKVAGREKKNKKRTTGRRKRLKIEDECVYSYL